MNRPIKFRAKTKVISGDSYNMGKSDGEWVKGCYYDDVGCAKIRQFETSYADYIGYEVDPETVGQYIDKVNDIEVFTNDIIKVYKHGDTESKPFIHQITYRNGTYWFGSWSWIEFLNIFRCVEVIGNVHDNPELEVQTDE